MSSANAVLALASGAVVVGLAGARRPAMSPRLTAMTAPRLRGEADETPRLASIRAVGTRVVSAVPMLARAGETWVGAAVIAGAVLMPWSAPLAAAAVAGLLGIGGWRRARRRRLDASIEAEQVVLLLHVLAVTLGAGGTLRAGIESAGESFRGPLARRLARANQHLCAGATTSEAVGALTAGMDDGHVALFERIRAAEASGSPVAPLVRGAADHLAMRQRRAAEIRARRLPVLMLLPLVCCVLPAFVVLAIVPMVLSGLPSLFPFP